MSAPALHQETPFRRPTLAPVVAINNVAPRHFTLTLRAPDIAATAKAGQFVHVLSRDAANRDPLLRRAFSIMAVHDDQIDILFRVEGRGTLWLSQAQVGDTIDLLGPLGQPFDLSVFQGKQENLPTPILVGGGVGVPPMVALGEALGRMNLSPLAIIGARSAPEILCEVQFAALGITPLITTEDGSLGRAGRVTTLLEEALERDRNAVVYSCGPFPMLRAVAAVVARYGARCQVSMEENMPCGIGVCNGCVVAMRPGSANASDYERYRRICIEGPAVWADEIDWEN